MAWSDILETLQQTLEDLKERVSERFEVDIVGEYWAAVEALTARQGTAAPTHQIFPGLVDYWRDGTSAGRCVASRSETGVRERWVVEDLDGYLDGDTGEWRVVQTFGQDGVPQVSDAQARRLAGLHPDNEVHPDGDGGADRTQLKAPRDLAALDGPAGPVYRATNDVVYRSLEAVAARAGASLEPPPGTAAGVWEVTKRVGNNRIAFGHLLRHRLPQAKSALGIPVVEYWVFRDDLSGLAGLPQLGESLILERVSSGSRAQHDPVAFIEAGRTAGDEGFALGAYMLTLA